MSSHLPSDKYTEVSCHPINAPGGNLSKGTGTYDGSTKTFSCGDFEHPDLPTEGAFYNLSGTSGDKKVHHFNGWKCVLSGKTSEFKES